MPAEVVRVSRLIRGIAWCMLLPMLFVGCGKTARGPQFKSKSSTGGTSTTAIKLDPLPDPKTPPEQVVAALLVSTSWVDTGIKAIVLPDGKSYAFTIGQNPQYHAFQLTAQQHSQLVSAFEHHHFLGFPKELRNPVTDGTDVVLIYANDSTQHRVLNYMFENADFSALRQRFEQLMTQGRQQEDSVTAEELIAAVEQQVDGLPEKSRQRSVAEEWLKMTRQLTAATKRLDVAKPPAVPAESKKP